MSAKDLALTTEEYEQFCREWRDDAAASLGSANTEAEAAKCEEALRGATERWLTAFVASAKEDRLARNQRAG